MVHELKILEEFADAVARGDKMFEIRREGERWFEVGDKIRFIVVDGEGTPLPCHALNRMSHRVTYVLREWDGLKPGHVALGIKRLGRATLDLAADAASQPIFALA